VSTTADEWGMNPAQRPSYLKRLWSRRDFTMVLALSNIRARNASTALGLVWWILNPLLLAGIYFIVFGIIFGAGEDDPSYFPFLLTGLFVFYYTRSSLMDSAAMITSNARLITTVDLPRLSLVLAGLIESAFGFLASMLVYLVVGLSLGVDLGWHSLWFLAAFVLQTIFNLGLGATTARLSVPFRDVRNLLPYVTRIWLYMSPIVYAIGRVPDYLRPVLILNPMTAYLSLYRAALLGDPLSWKLMLAAVLWAALVGGVGVLLFTKTEGKFVRYL
jgi:teichoic acid transport system permease protein